MSQTIIESPPVIQWKQWFNDVTEQKRSTLQTFQSRKNYLFQSARQFWLSTFLDFWQWATRIIGIVIPAYSLYMALVFNEPRLLFISWSLHTVIVALHLWSSDNLSLLKRVRLSFYVPMLYWLSPFVTLFEVASSLTALANRQLTTSSRPHKYRLKLLLAKQS